MNVATIAPLPAAALMRAEATLDPEVKPFDELEPPEIDPATLNGPAVTDLMTQAGLL